MRTSNIMTGLAIAVWFALALVGVHAVDGIVVQGVRGYPNMGQINGYIVWPFLVAIALFSCAWLCNLWRRGGSALALFSGVSLAAALPYLAIGGGGI